MNNNLEKIRVLLISEIPLSENTASGVILKRHRDLFPGEMFPLLESGLMKERPRWQSALLNRIKHISPNSVGLWIHHWEPRRKARQFAKALRKEKFDLALILAHGSFGIHAWRLAQALKIPVFTIFHDWWPEILEDHHPGFSEKLKSRINNDFYACQINSKVSFAVCEGMKQHLAGDKIVVLPPIPDPAIKFSNKTSPDTPLKIVYTGSLWHPYGKMVTDLVAAASDDTRLDFKIYGDPKYIDNPLRQKLLDAGILNKYVSGHQYIDLITNQADVLLAVMGEPKPGTKRMLTSFPSKTANYFRTGNPVLIWAPEETTLGAFCLEKKYECWVQSSNPKEVVYLLKKIVLEKKYWIKAREDSNNMGRLFFSHKVISLTLNEMIKFTLN